VMQSKLDMALWDYGFKNIAHFRKNADQFKWGKAAFDIYYHLPEIMKNKRKAMKSLLNLMKYY